VGHVRTCPLSLPSPQKQQFSRSRQYETSLSLTGSRLALLPALGADEEFASCRPSLVDAPSLEPAPIPAPLPVGERCSSVWYSIEPEATDDDLVRAIASAQPLRRRPQPWSVLRSLASGAGLGALALCGFVAMGASQPDEPEPRASRAAFTLPVVHATSRASAGERAAVPHERDSTAPVPFAPPLLGELPDRELEPVARPPAPERKPPRRKLRARPPRFSLYGVPQNPF
jgi:hypothetical protein